MVVQDPNHPSTAGLPARWKVQDEIYSFNLDPRLMGAKVVLSVDETTYQGPSPYSITYSF